MRRLALGLSVVGLGVLVGCTSPRVQNVNTQTPAPSNVNVVVPTNANVTVTNSTVNTNIVTNVNASAVDLKSPLDRPTERITKKFFGTYVTPQHSPVQPERFTGFHTGVDFETFPSEANTDVPVVAACSGKVRAAQYVSGYGGVLVQQCVVAGQTVTALYGHVRLTSVSVKVGATLNAGTQFAMLGTGYSSETNGERKHLHFSLHKGTAIVWKGYVSTKGALGDWLDPQQYL